MVVTQLRLPPQNRIVEQVEPDGLELALQHKRVSGAEHMELWVGFHLQLVNCKDMPTIATITCLLGQCLFGDDFVCRDGQNHANGNGPSSQTTGLTFEHFRQIQAFSMEHNLEDKFSFQCLFISIQQFNAMLLQDGLRLLYNLHNC